MDSAIRYVERNLNRTHRTMSRNRIRTALIALAFVAPDYVTAQSSTRLESSVGAVVGITQFDLSGTGTAPVVSIRAEQEINRFLVVEGAVTLFRPKEQFGTRRTFIVPEVQLQLQLPAEIVRPYLGVGVGGAFISNGGGSQEVISAAGGIRAAISKEWDVRGELRVRNIGKLFTGATADWTAGFARRF